MVRRSATKNPHYIMYNLNEIKYNPGNFKDLSTKKIPIWLTEKKQQLAFSVSYAHCHKLAILTRQKTCMTGNIKLARWRRAHLKRRLRTWESKLGHRAILIVVASREDAFSDYRRTLLANAN